MTDSSEIERIQALVSRLRADYAEDPNIASIGFGMPRRGGDYKDGVAILFRVRRKLPSARAVEAIGSRPIPRAIDGIETDIFTADLRPAADMMGQRDERKYDPLLGGVASSNIENHVIWFNGSGTLGVLATDNTTGKPVALSNWHVWAKNGEIGDRIIQPGHPTGDDHVQAVGKVLACGPLVTSVIEWEVPDPIAAGLYGGAAAAAVAAALSDYRDPTRRGQDATPTEPGERTLKERVSSEIDYYDLPMPGLPFRSEARWRYQRETDKQTLHHEVQEQTVNAQFLLAKTVHTDKKRYLPGEVATVSASIWDYQQARSCSDYHVVAHLLSQGSPQRTLRVVLHPSACEDFAGDRKCIDFGELEQRVYPLEGMFDWLRYKQFGHTTALYVVDFGEGARGIFLGGGNIFWHEPASRVRLRCATFTSEPIVMSTYANGKKIDETVSGTEQGVTYDLVIDGDGITEVRVSGGGGEAVILDYCIDPSDEGKFKHGMPQEYLDMILKNAKAADIDIDVAKARRCCFRGSVRIPATSDLGNWNVHLTVQNVNNVPDGIAPEDAATVIGGHVVGANAQAAGCIGIMLFDHAFEVI
jgi:hypothetical protein